MPWHLGIPLKYATDTGYCFAVNICYLCKLKLQTTMDRLLPLLAMSAQSRFSALPQLRHSPNFPYRWHRSSRPTPIDVFTILHLCRKVTDDLEKAELLNRTFASKFSDPAVTEFPQAASYQLDPLVSFRVSEGAVRQILCNLSPHKACGPDNVSARVIRECAVELSVPITKICRLSLNQGVFPLTWKRANIVHIHKKGPKTCANNYRSVSLLPLFGKVLVVFTELFQYVKPAISDQQHGIMPGRSCATNLCTMLHTA